MATRKINWILAIKLVISFHVIAFLIIFILWPLYTNNKRDAVKSMYDSYRNNERIYCYDIKANTVGPVYYVTEINQTLDLINYYVDLDKGINSQIKFPPKKILTTKNPVILVQFTSDSLIAEFIDINTSCWGFEKGYLLYRMVHKNLPPDSLLNDYKRLTEEHDVKNDFKDNFNHSIYGVQCD
jgi:hypothetical protein